MFVPLIKEIHVEPTTVCQAECPMCPRTVQGYHIGKVANSFLRLEDYQEKIWPYVNQLDKVLFCGTLGEPAACADLLEMIEWTIGENPNCHIGMNSNGGLKTPHWWTKLAELTRNNPLSYVVFSLDGLKDTNHLYRRKVDWDAIEANVKAFIDAGGNAQWDMLVFKHNEHQVIEAKELATKLGFKMFRTKVTSRFTPGDGFDPPTGGPPIIGAVPLSCMAENTRSLYLSAEGKWYPCCYTHMSNETGFDRSWGKKLSAAHERGEAWKELEESLKTTPKKVCDRSCGSTYNQGQWTSEWVLNA